jgi:CBS domain-containing protein
MRVRDLMQRDVVTLAASDTLDLADDIMRLGRIRHLPVTSAGEVVGILSQRDLFRAAISSLLQLDRSAEQAFLAKVPVRAMMTPAPVTVGPEESVRAAVRLMLERKIGCLPVVEDGRLVGLVSETDCLGHLEHLLAIAEAKGLLPELGTAS